MISTKYTGFLFVMAGLIVLCGCTGTGDDVDGVVNVNVENIKKHIVELSDDAYRGRKPFTSGEEKTVDYIKSEFEKMGVQPGNGDSYFQEVPLVEITGKPASTMEIVGSSTVLTFQFGTDYVISTEREQDSVQVTNSDLVFCGFGVVAPEYGWNDYAGLDMEGKTAVVLVNDPGFGTESDSVFKGNIMTYYGRWTYKYEEAERQGAEAILIIHETTSAGYPWQVVQTGFSGASLQLQSDEGHSDKPALQGWISLDAAKRLFEAADIDLAVQIREARKQGFTPVPMAMQMSTSLENTFERNTSRNVIGRIEGKERPQETIIYTAHWDHLGVGPAVDGDSIYNGARDNATGTAAVLEIARAFTLLEEAPDRSLVFLLVTAEEEGLLGSQWYAEHPVYPLNKTVANMNMDALSTTGETDDLAITGYGHSDLDDYAAEAAEDQERYVTPDPEPEKGYFFRSDHFNFAKVGVPALYAKGGLDHRARGREYGEAQERAFRAEHYHQPSDEFTEDTDLGAVRQDAELYFEIGRRLADEETFPQWKEGSEFKRETPRGQ